MNEVPGDSVQPDVQRVDYDVVRQLQTQVADILTAEKQRRVGAGEVPLSREDEQQYALSLIATQVQVHMHGRAYGLEELPDSSYDARLASAVFAAIYQAGALQDLLDDSDIEDIDINGCDEVWITYSGAPRPVRGHPVATSDEELIEIVQGLASTAGLNARPFSPASPMLDLRLPGSPGRPSARLSAMMLAGERPSVSIRLNRFPQVRLDRLVEFGTVSAQLAAFLQAAVLARFNIMIAGSTGAGKTTLLRALINCIQGWERIVTIERSLELGLRQHPELHPNCLEWEEVLPDAEGRGGISLDQLVQRSRRQHPDRVILGEILGPEVVTTLEAMSQGNDGSLSTLHARSALDTFHKLSTYGARFQGLTVDQMHLLIAGSVDFIVFTRQDPVTGQRAVAEVLEVNGMAGPRAASAHVFVPSPVDGRAVRDSEIIISRAEALRRAGYDDAEWPVTGPWAG